MNGRRHETSLLVSSGEVNDLPGVCDLRGLAAAVEPLLAKAAVQVLLLGAGDSFAPAPADFAERMAARRVGVETMSTDAACRTFNVLASEGRRVWAALLVGGS